MTDEDERNLSATVGVDIDTDEANRIMAEEISRAKERIAERIAEHATVE